MATTSIAATVKAAVVSTLSAHSTITAGGVVVSYSMPNNIFLRECFYFYGASGRTAPHLIGGTRSRDETVPLLFAINAWVPGQTGTVADQRALAIYAAVEDTIADNPELGGVSWFDSLTWTLGATPDFEGWDGLITGELTYTARLT